MCARQNTNERRENRKKNPDTHKVDWTHIQQTKKKNISISNSIDKQCHWYIVMLCNIVKWFNRVKVWKRMNASCKWNRSRKKQKNLNNRGYKTPNDKSISSNFEKWSSGLFHSIIQMPHFNSSYCHCSNSKNTSSIDSYQKMCTSTKYDEHGKHTSNENWMCFCIWEKTFFLSSLLSLLNIVATFQMYFVVQFS